MTDAERLERGSFVTWRGCGGVLSNCCCADFEGLKGCADFEGLKGCVVRIVEDLVEVEVVHTSRKLHALSITRHGDPGHPLFLPYRRNELLTIDACPRI